MSTNPGPETPVLSARGVSKRFATVQALSDVTVECLAGEIHAVVGENGSGKSTLLGIASGVLSPDEGAVEIGGQRLGGASAAHARELGLAMAYQTYSHILDLSVAENLYLATPADERPPFRSLNAWAAARLKKFDLDLPAAVPIGSVPLPSRQLLEVVKALLTRPAVLLLDEPTTALGPAEVDRLHELVLRESQRGVGILYVSHRLPEVLGIASRVTVLRDGHHQGTMPAAGLSEDSLIALMIGRPLDQAFPERHRNPDRQEVLSARGVQGRQLGPIDLTLRRGEILGIAGAAGNGQTELLHCLSGAERPTGTISCDGRPIELRTPHTALRAGIGLLSGDRVREALFPVLSVRSNATIQVLRRFAAGGLLRPRREADAVEGLVRSLKVRTPSIEQPVRFLSGGNQQKVSLMRPFVRDEIKVVVTDEPTQGVDVGSRFDIYEALRAKANEGVAVIVNSSDPIELSGLCDRVIVLSRGRIVDEIPGEELGEQRIIEAIVGRRSTHRDQRAGPVPADATPVRAPVLAKAGLRPVRSIIPLVLMAFLMLAVGGYTSTRSSAFLTEYNLNSLLLSALPLALVSMGQASALLVGGFDVSVGALVSMCVVVGSYTLQDGLAWYVLLPGALALLGVGLAVGFFNASLVRLVRLPSIIATLATLSILQGVALALRPTPAGSIDANVSDSLVSGIGAVPYAFVGVVVLAVAADAWLYRTRGGLQARGVGLDESSTLRLGIWPEWVQWRAYVVASLFAALAAYFVAAQVNVGDAGVGSSYTLQSIAAAVLGGAALSGGRGSFFGAAMGALFLSLIINVLPLLGWGSDIAQISVGALTLLALIVYQGSELWRGLLGALRTGQSWSLPRPGAASGN